LRVGNCRAHSPLRSMRIAIITTDVREHKRDYTGTVATFGTAPTALLQGLALLPDVEVHVLSCARRPMKSQEKLAKNIWFHSIHVPRLGWMRTGYQGCIRAVRKTLRIIKPDLVHGQGTELDCAVDAAFSGFPNVITVHGNMRIMAEVNRAKRFSFLWLAARLERFTLPRTDGVICITAYTEKAVSKLVRRTWIVPNAVDSAFFDITAQATPGEAPRIVCLGVIEPRKNQNSFIMALDHLAENYKFQLIFLGEGPPNSPYVNEFHRLVKARPWCTAAGFAGREQVRKHLSTAALLVLPSLEDNCPMVILEAMAAGVPVVGSNVAGVPELIRDGVTGLLCDPFDKSSILSAVQRILLNPSAAAEMAERAKSVARTRFLPEVVARRHVEVYREVLSSDE
jgi:glycosyltransferase involved in cell wall biosynthesis